MVAAIFNSGLIGLVTAGVALVALCAAQLLQLLGAPSPTTRWRVGAAAVLLSLAALVLIVGRFAALG
jgi:hypothetical protein